MSKITHTVICEKCGEEIVIIFEGESQYLSTDLSKLNPRCINCTDAQ